ncbi:uncharacterized protein K460DRAFT_350942 [Cucurbitaria berberidis CBS 394.84]|uniref:Uncharacterized protein n=1 Tax=Cucurbitaria berberidis CBS 394.84 TaxID=1168544 RepID=A0A9P4LEC0_9PLEO|nr:uncharacterized protein K460DRAFT_350942 [Cucurbitaria berberidis CBS 394.84]KAF1850954.1 hypothetical protein K460DRAFT_350942 [Cucurbitaria berberidis CBS 394.84]
MTTFAPPARRGDFLYSSLLYASAGPTPSNAHPRATVAELAALLRPPAPKFQPDLSSSSSPVAKDPPWHFWTAQLIHYGLPVTKEKNAAKVRLLNALNSFQLEVPEWVRRVEGELKSEWEGANRRGGKSSQASKQEGTRGVGLGSSQGSGGVNVTGGLVSMGEQVHSSGQKAPNSSAKKAVPTKRKRRNSDDLCAIPHPATPKKASNTRIKSESTTPRKHIKKEPAPVSSPARPRVKRELTSPRSSPYIKPDPYANDRSRTPAGTLLSGAYSIAAFCDNPQYDNDVFTLTLYRDSSHHGNTWWATIAWGPLDGIIQMNPGPGDTLGRSCSLGWRVRDVQVDCLTFGRKCTGEMTFFANQTLRGALHNVPDMGTVEIEGTRLPGPSAEWDFQDEWDAFPREAYGR